MDQPRHLGAQLSQRFSHGSDQIPRKRTCKLSFDPSRIGERPQNVEDRTGAQFGARRHDMCNGRVVHGRHHEAYASLVQGRFDHFGPDHDVDSHLRQRVRRAGFGGQIAVAVLGDRHARPCHDKGRGGRNVQCAFAISASADDVHGTVRRVHCVTLGAHDSGGRCVFIHSFAAGAQRHQQPANLARRCLAIEQDLKGLFGLCTGQGAVGCGINQGLECVTHVGTGSRSTKFCSMAWPCSDRMDSG